MVLLITEETVCRELRLDPAEFARWLELGLVERTEIEGERGFTPQQVRRIWSVASMQRDLDVNVEGVQIILDLCTELQELKVALREAAHRLQSQEKVEQFRLRVMEEITGTGDWEIEI